MSIEYSLHVKTRFICPTVPFSFFFALSPDSILRFPLERIFHLGI